MTTSHAFEIAIAAKDFASSLALLTSVMERKNVNPVLSCVKLEVEDNQLVLQATDGSIFVKQVLGAKIVHADMSVAVDGKLLERALKGFGDQLLEIKYLPDSCELLVSSPGFELRQVLLEAESFPKFPRLYTDALFEIPCLDLMRLINCTEFSSSRDEIRYNLNGVCLHCQGEGRIYAASTDVFRLSTFSVAAPDHAKSFKVILPSKTVDFFKNFSSSAFENHLIKAKVSNNLIEFSLLNTVIVSKLIDGQFPDYQSLIPKNNVNKLTIKKSIFASSIERVAVMTDDKSKAIKILLGSQAIEISAYTHSKGQAKQYIDNRDFFHYEGDVIDIAFQPKYLLDVLSLIKEDVEIDIALKDASSPIIITCNKLADGLFVVMPVKI